MQHQELRVLEIVFVRFLCVRVNNASVSSEKANYLLTLFHFFAAKL